MHILLRNASILNQWPIVFESASSWKSFVIGNVWGLVGQIELPRLGSTIRATPSDVLILV